MAANTREEDSVSKWLPLSLVAQQPETLCEAHYQQTLNWDGFMLKPDTEYCQCAQKNPGIRCAQHSASWKLWDQSLQGNFTDSSSQNTEELHTGKYIVLTRALNESTEKRRKQKDKRWMGETKASWFTDTMILYIKTPKTPLEKQQLTYTLNNISGCKVNI